MTCMYVICMYTCMYKLYLMTVKTWLQSNLPRGRQEIKVFTSLECWRSMGPMHWRALVSWSPHRVAVSDPRSEVSYFRRTGASVNRTSGCVIRTSGSCQKPSGYGRIAMRPRPRSCPCRTEIRLRNDTIKSG